MRLILKTKDRYINFYWINIQSKSIVGWFAQDFIRVALGIPKEFHHFDSHFTFPANGNYHFSYKSNNKGREEYTTVFWDSVKIKIILNGIRQIIEKSKVDLENENPYIGILAPDYKQEVLDKITIFQFPLIGFNVYSGNIEPKVGERIINPKDISDDDLIVDISLFDNVNLAIYAVIRNISKNEFFTDDVISSYTKQILMTNGRCLELICNVFKI